MRIGIDARMSGMAHAGIGRYVENLVRELSKSEALELVVFVRDKEQLTIQQYNNITIVEADIPHYSLAEQFLMPGIIAKAKVDLVHFPHFNLPVLYRGKYVVTIHDLIKHTSRGMATTTWAPWLYWLKYLGYRFVFNQAIKRATKILVPSQAVKRELLQAYNLPEEKVVITYEGVSETFKQSAISNQQSTIILSKYNIQKPFVIYTGSLYPHKNVERLAEAVKCSNDLYHDSRKLSLVVVCARSVFYERFKRKIIEQMKTENDVKMIGFVSDEELAVLYTQAGAFVFPTLSEGFGLPGLEAMACGCPVICSDIPVLREVYGEAAIYFNPLDTNDIIQKIKEVCSNDSNHRDKVIKRGFEQVKKYSWQKMARETLEVYKQAV